MVRLETTARFTGAMRALAASVVFALAALLLAPASAQAREVFSVSGENRYETAAAQALAAYPEGAEVAIVVSGQNWADSLSASGLAGALDCPILLSSATELPDATAQALSTLGVERIVVVGGEGSVGSAPFEAMRLLLEGGETDVASSSIARVAGGNRYATQMAVYEYGRTGFDGANHWGSTLAIAATGTAFADALCASPLAAAHAAPLFLVPSSGLLSEDQEKALLDGGFQATLVVGDSNRIAPQTVGFLRAVAMLAPAAGGEAIATGENAATTGAYAHLYGATAAETSAVVAKWAVDQGLLQWEGTAFASAGQPYDALAGSALQGKKGAALLLIDDALAASIDAFARNASDVSRYGYLGGTGSIPDTLRTYVAYSLDLGRSLPMGESRASEELWVVCDRLGVQAEYTVVERWEGLARGYSSSTDWLILVDTKENKTAVFTGEKNAWQLHKLWDCTTGAPWTPTVKGQFNVGNRGLAFGVGYTCWWWTQFYNDYLFHSVLYEPGSRTVIQDGRLGINASHGCVRLDILNAKWIYDNIPRYTKVVTY